MTEDDFQYAIENTRVILAPERQIASFGSTSFRFYLISELMDQVNEVRVRDGRIHAERPQILTPEHYCRLLLEGFGEKAQKYVDQLREHTRDVAVLRYGFQFRKTDVTENTVRDTMDAVIARTKLKVEHSEEPLSAVIQGVDDAWEVCLLKFTIDLIERSTGGNMGDFRKRGLIFSQEFSSLWQCPNVTKESELFRRERNKEAKRHIVSEEMLREVVYQGMYRIRLSRVVYDDNLDSFIDLRVFQRGGYDDNDEEMFHPTRRGFQIAEKEWVKLVEGHFFENLEAQIQRDPR